MAITGKLSQSITTKKNLTLICNIIPTALGPGPLVTSIYRNQSLNTLYVVGVFHTSELLFICYFFANFESSHLYLYSAFNNTNCNKALHSIKIGKLCKCKMTRFNSQFSAEGISLLNLVMASSSSVQFK